MTLRGGPFAGEEWAVPPSGRIERSYGPYRACYDADGAFLHVVPPDPGWPDPA